MAVDERDMVLEGRDGFLFLANDTNELLEQQAGRRMLTEAQLQQWRELIERRMERVAAIGAHWTDCGAFASYRSLMDGLAGAVQARVLTAHDIYYMDDVTDVDLGSKLDPPRVEHARTARVVHHASYPIFDNCVFSSRIL